MFSAGLNMAFRDVVTDQREFEIKRFKAMGNYAYVTAGIERIQKLPGDLSLFVKCDGQLANQPLISNEQYTAGGMDSVRGYKESEETGDDALHGTAELLSPDLGKLVNRADIFSLKSFVFYDVAALRIQDPLPEENAHKTLQGAGAGIRGSLFDHVDFEAVWASALEDTDRIKSGDCRWHFRVELAF